jgi:signal transduction histidine kinase
MSQVARNILSNAIKFTPKGGEVTINTKVEIDLNYSAALTPSLGKLSRMPSRFFNVAVAASPTPSPFTGDSIVPNGKGSISEPKRGWYQALLPFRSKTNNVVPTSTIHMHSHTSRTGGDTSKATSHQPVELIFHEVPGAKPYGSIQISVTDTGPGIAKVSHNFFQIFTDAILKSSNSYYSLCCCCFNLLVRRISINYSKNMFKLILVNYRKVKDQD